MRDIKVEAKTIGSSVVGEHVVIEQFSASVTSNEGLDEGTLVEILKNCAALQATSTGVSDAQMREFAETITQTIRNALQAPDSTTKRKILTEGLERAKDVVGLVVPVLDGFFKLRSMLGV